MGRLFQYNRFGTSETTNKRKKDTSKSAHDKAKMVSCKRHKAKELRSEKEIFRGHKWGFIKK